MNKLKQIKKNLEYIIGVFEDYVEHHKNKGDRESLMKAQANNAYAAKLRRALNLLDELREEVEWQPIETAPKDGSDIELADFSNPKDVIITSDYWHEYNINGQMSGDWENFGCYGGDYKPTHWKPITQLPRKAR